MVCKCRMMEEPEEGFGGGRKQGFLSLVRWVAADWHNSATETNKESRANDECQAIHVELGASRQGEGPGIVGEW